MSDNIITTIEQDDFVDVIEEAAPPKGNGADTTSAYILDPNDPLETARLYIEAYHRIGDTRTLHRYQGTFRVWDDVVYQDIEDDAMACSLYGFLGSASRRVKVGEEWGIAPYKPNRAKVANVIDALKAEAFLSGAVTPPTWLNGNGPAPAKELIVCKNCLVHLPTGRTFPNTPNLFTTNAIPVAYDPEAGEPIALHQFLDDLFDDDLERRDTLQEVFGYLLTTDTRHQKIPLIPGPKRAGKGVIGRVLRGLLGKANVCNPTLASLQSNFGLSALLGKQVAIITDARLGRADQHVVAERLLSVSGEDGIDIDRKYMAPLTGVRLPTRFVILTNELPRIADVSGALASRFIVIPLTESFYGREDHGLTDRLLGERPAILNWAIEGWKRLQERGRFQQPSAGEEAIRELEDLSSPTAAFLRDRTAEAPGFNATPEDLFRAWGEWCEGHGRDHKGTMQVFCRDLRTARPNLKTTRTRKGEDRQRVYEGIRVLSEWERSREAGGDGE